MERSQRHASHAVDYSSPTQLALPMPCPKTGYRCDNGLEKLDECGFGTCSCLGCIGTYGNAKNQNLFGKETIILSKTQFLSPFNTNSWCGQAFLACNVRCFDARQNMKGTVFLSFLRYGGQLHGRCAHGCEGGQGCRVQKQSCVDGKLHTSPQRQAIGDDLRTAVVMAGSNNVQVAEQDVGGNRLEGDALGHKNPTRGQEARWPPYTSRRARQRHPAESKRSGKRRRLNSNSRKGAEPKRSSRLVGKAVNINFNNTMWNGVEYCVFCWVPRQDWIGACRGIRFCTAGTDVFSITKKNIPCKVGLRHVFANIGNSLRTSQVCHPELGSGVLWNGSQLELAWADHKVIGAHSSKPLLGSWDGKIGRHMPDTPKIGNVCVMLSLALRLSDV